MIPIFIISFNRLTVLRTLINRFVGMGQTRLIIIDNHSDYEPLLQYYQGIEKDFDILRMRENFGHDVIRAVYADSEIRGKYGLESSDYAYTDNDVVPVEECPWDFLEKFALVMRKYGMQKVGFSLRIDDLPDCFEAKQRVIGWESTFWENRVRDEELGFSLYPAAIDTTFALQKANTVPGWKKICYRVGSPYMARHLPWYVDSLNLSDEEIYYMKTAVDAETHFPGRYREKQ